ncbi:MAG: hypothetical protein KatS3mg018_1047 [Fimbriimonadales bacterium]|nr:MAG: hypothetical protein KatS3mg018_1047 [Fimbriimonadales bacterium]
MLGEYKPINLWQIAPASDLVPPAVLPLALASQIVRLYSYVGDLVFDPFAGRGTLGRAALLNERHYSLTEKEPAYFEYAQKVITEGNRLGPEYPPRFMTFESFEQMALAQLTEAARQDWVHYWHYGSHRGFSADF